MSNQFKFLVLFDICDMPLDGITPTPSAVTYLSLSLKYDVSAKTVQRAVKQLRSMGADIVYTHVLDIGPTLYCQNSDRVFLNAQRWYRMEQLQTLLTD
jgi:hypothetical protein